MAPSLPSLPGTLSNKFIIFHLFIAIKKKKNRKKKIGSAFTGLLTICM
jgi:hypothetical protein